MKTRTKGALMLKRLFIGLGGIGCEVIKNNVLSNFICNDYYFLLNNDTMIKEYAAFFEESNASFNNVFTFDLSLNLRTINPFDFDDMKTYFDTQTYSLIRDGINYGASSIRAIGRLQFEYFIRKEYLRNTFNKIITQNDKISIVIVSSLYGGFGSACILPLAIKIKSLLLDLGVLDEAIEVSIIGITTQAHQHVFSQTIMKYYKANAYATAKEIYDVMHLSTMSFQPNIPELYEIRKTQKHIKQFLAVEQKTNNRSNSIITDVAKLLCYDTRKYTDFLNENELKQADILLDDNYKNCYYSVTNQLHIDIRWENEKVLNRKTNYKVFLSYCSFDNDLADIIDEFMSKYENIKVSRFTRDVGYKGSFKEFMGSLNQHDHVVMLISDKYLKSTACMYEVGELLNNKDFKNKIIFIVLSPGDEEFYKKKLIESNIAKVYDPMNRTDYILYWETEYKKIYDRIKLIESESAKIELLQTLREIRKIIDQDISPFLKYISDARGKSFNEMYKTNFSDILREIEMDKV
ncbi:tubulin-like doman-containing protein [Desulfosporosinus sp. PR]|uniref:tubulin-like doman-containing protein n=1 Tax=Candidatus Desulfosporosinus nitrosoreducens TaxID=3401928 RepID=UPI0027EB95D5|nr:tubulin-like doman-containing protein [Desulfosporosinus sp. PR]MDQ7094343.1 tubulin-like doman-containing protein [Desulfosporosinus sp. PR]